MYDYETKQRRGLCIVVFLGVWDVWDKMDGRRQAGGRIISDTYIIELS